mgnify:CR=1 FL=1
MHSFDYSGHSSGSRRAQLAHERRIVARHPTRRRRGRMAGSAPARRSSPADAADFSPLAPLHGSVPRWPSQTTHANRKCVAQASLDSSRRERLLSTVCMNRKPAPVNMHATLAEARRQAHGPIRRWNRMLMYTERRHHECRTVCEKRLRGQSDPSMTSPGSRRSHVLPSSSDLPFYRRSEP